MKQTQSILISLKRLAELNKMKRRLDLGAPELSAIIAETAATRESLPTAMLKHYDDRLSRGRPAIASVRGGCCGGCHLSLPSGRLAELRRADATLHVCDNCGVIIYQDEQEQAQQQESPQAPPAKVRRSPSAKKKSAPVPTGSTSGSGAATAVAMVLDSTL